MEVSDSYFVEHCRCERLCSLARQKAIAKQPDVKPVRRPYLAHGVWPLRLRHESACAPRARGAVRTGVIEPVAGNPLPVRGCVATGERSATRYAEVERAVRARRVSCGCAISGARMRVRSALRQSPRLTPLGSSVGSSSPPCSALSSSTPSSHLPNSKRRLQAACSGASSASESWNRAPGKM